MSNLSLFKTNLRFNIIDGILSGWLDGKPISMKVYSGGGGGSTSKNGPDEPLKINNPFMTNSKTFKDMSGKYYLSRGGSIPEGTYIIGKPYKHPHLGTAAPIIEMGKQFDRDGFYFHGRGLLGSDGCIVPAYPIDYQKLMLGLENSEGGKLEVVW